MIEAKIKECIKNLERNMQLNNELMESIMTEKDLTTTHKAEIIEATHRENREIGIKLELLYHLAIDCGLK